MNDCVNIDFDNVLIEYYKIQKRCESLVHFSSVLSKNLIMASKNFQNENFERASSHTLKTRENLKLCIEKINALKSYLSKLQEFLEKYNSSTY